MTAGTETRGPVAALPDRETFDRLAGEFPLVPIWTELLADASTPVALFASLAADGPGALLESVERSERWGRYSFVTADPAAIVVGDEHGLRLERVVRALPVVSAAGSTAEALRALSRDLRAPKLPGLPPFTGGLVGSFDYEAAGLLDPAVAVTIPSERCAPAPVRLLIADRAVVFDHWAQRLFVVVHAPTADGYSRAREALDAFVERVVTASPMELRPPSAAAGVRIAESTTRHRYERNVLAVKEHIAAGDIFQGVLSRFVQVQAPDAFAVYRMLRVTNPSPYMFFVRTPGLELAGSSPEPLVRVEGRRVMTRPIAGTRRRTGDPDRDTALGRALLADAKECAEHAMLVDLGRNDLGKVCVPGSVCVTEFQQVEAFARVLHIVSTVEGDLAPGATAVDALAATFPAGTVTGAPKRRAMEIIAELEATPRGPYAGATGYLSFAGDLDACITIRTAVVQDGVARIQAGAGVVADSDPAAEYAETEAKMSALLAATGPLAETETPR